MTEDIFRNCNYFYWAKQTWHQIWSQYFRNKQVLIYNSISLPGILKSHAFSTVTKKSRYNWKTFANCHIRTPTVKTRNPQCYILSQIREGWITALRLGDGESPNYSLPNSHLWGAGKKKLTHVRVKFVDIKHFKLDM